MQWKRLLSPSMVRVHFVQTEKYGVLTVPPPTIIMDLKSVGGLSSYTPATLFEALTNKNMYNVLGMSMDYWSPSDTVLLLLLLLLLLFFFFDHYLSKIIIMR